jgi:penicillin-binding protein-related factor A (putative recombinase)
MRVRFQVSNRYFCLERQDLYQIGEIANIQDDMAEAFIEIGVVEPFEDSITDEEIKELYKKFTNTKNFERKVDLLMEVIAKSNKQVQIKDGTDFLFEVTPNKPNEWYYYNKRLSEFYINNFYRCRLDSFIQDFKRKLKNYPSIKILRKTELDRITKILNDNYSTGILYWYKKGINGEIPIDEKEMEIFLSKEIYNGLVDYLQGKVLAEYVAYLNALNLKTLQSTVNQKEVKFQITGIDLSKLVQELVEQDYFNLKYKTDVINWFKGIKPENQIKMNVRANFFLSIIADLCDAKPPFIKNKKNFCYEYIRQSFLFRGEEPKISYIEKVMKPNNENRLICSDKTIPDIQSFKTST